MFPEARYPSANMKNPNNLVTGNTSKCDTRFALPCPGYPDIIQTPLIIMTEGNTISQESDKPNARTRTKRRKEIETKNQDPTAMRTPCGVMT